VPTGVDAPLALKFTFSEKTSNYRSVIYVNGWQFGRFINNLGPQAIYPVSWNLRFFALLGSHR
jgi:hypothetical protein